MKVELKSISCPTCGDKLKFEEYGETVICMSCGNSVKVTENKENTTVSSSSNKVEEIKTSSTALAYIEQFLNDYDWDSFVFDNDFSIDELDKLVNKLKIVAADDPQTWIAAFVCLVTPFEKKIIYRQEALKTIVAEYSKDNLDAYGMYDAYKKAAQMIVAKYADVTAQANKILDYAKKYGADAKIIKAFEQRLAGLSIDQIKNTIFDDIEKVPEIVSIREKEQAEYVAELEGNGINAESVYASAKACEEQKEYKDALQKYLSIYKYKDSINRINEIEDGFVFSNVLFIQDKFYYLKKGEEQATYGLYEVVDKKLSSHPILKGISEIVATYGNTIYYVGKNGFDKSLSCYDFDKKANQVICKKIKSNAEFKFDLLNSALYVVNKLEIENAGDQELLKVNVYTNEVTSCVNEIDSVVGFSDNNYFTFKKKVKKDEKTLETCIYDLIKGKTYVISNKGIEVCGFIKDNAVYTVKNPDDYNKNVYVATLGDEITTTLIEANITGKCEVFDNRIYYFTLDSVGTKVLISNSLDGKDRKELANYADRILFVSGSWVYFIKSYRYNTAIWKVKENGSQLKRIASQIDEFVKIDAGYLYYVDDDRNMHKVRMDGTRNTILCSHVNKVLAIKDRKVVFTALDRVLTTEKVSDFGTEMKETKSDSIYAIDFDNGGRRKAVYDVISTEYFGKECLYYIKKKQDGVQALYVLNINDYTTKKIADLDVVVEKKGCYVATCVYGSYDCPEVWTLRRYRDQTLGSTRRGRAFIKLYYAISPKLVKMFGKTKWFKKLWKGKLDRMVKKLNDSGVENTPYNDKDWN